MLGTKSNVNYHSSIGINVVMFLSFVAVNYNVLFYYILIPRKLPESRKNTICLPSKTSKRINVLGFLNKIHHELIPFVFEETVTADVVVEIFDAFSAQIQNPTLVVMDNASIHTSDHFFNQIENWQEKGLFPYFLPTYSPELNAIEILWRKIKYEWLSFSAYDHFKKLQEAVDEVLIHFDIKYLITFA
ncbi:Transposase [Beggiatoa sp. PS]|nr:Transposase [Beggiatoa sp. PS]